MSHQFTCGSEPALKRFLIYCWSEDKIKFGSSSPLKKKEMKPSPLSKSSRKRQKQHVYDKVKTRPGLELTSLVWGPQHLLQVIRHCAVKLRELKGSLQYFISWRLQKWYWINWRGQVFTKGEVLPYSCREKTSILSHKGESDLWPVKYISCSLQVSWLPHNRLVQSKPMSSPDLKYSKHTH